MFASTIMLLTTLFHIDNELNSTKKILACSLSCKYKYAF